MAVRGEEESMTDEALQLQADHQRLLQALANRGLSRLSEMADDVNYVLQLAQQGNPVARETLIGLMTKLEESRAFLAGTPQIVRPQIAVVNGPQR
jgi:hypothetical protein